MDNKNFQQDTESSISNVPTAAEKEKVKAGVMEFAKITKAGDVDTVKKYFSDAGISEYYEGLTTAALEEMAFMFIGLTESSFDASSVVWLKRQGSTGRIYIQMTNLLPPNEGGVRCIHSAVLNNEAWYWAGSKCSN